MQPTVFAHSHRPPPFLPRRDADLVWRARNVAELAGWLLASTDADLFCVGVDDADPLPVIIAWRRDGPAGDRLAASDCAYPAILAPLERATAALVSALRDRWPPYARPPRLGGITDGAGLAFCPDEPWPLEPGWLARRERPGGGLTRILPFAPKPCATWLTEMAGRSPH